jgi:type I restriction enzyme M protein
MDKSPGSRCGQVLFTDAREFGYLVDRAERALTSEEVTRIGDTYHAWCSSPSAAAKGISYQDVPGFCRSVSLEDISAAGYALTPGRYVGAPAAQDDGEPVDDKISRLTEDLLAALDESARLDQVVREQVERLW